jgi:hypothetical protein
VKRHLFAGYMLFAGAFLLFTAGLCQAENHGEGEEGSYAVALSFDKSRPVIGTNQVKITVTDAASQPVAAARVKVSYFMPSLRGKPPMMGRSTAAKASNGTYGATLKFTRKGEWRIIVTVAGPERTDEVAFAFEIE